MASTISPWRAFPADPRDWYSAEEISKAQRYQRTPRIVTKVSGALTAAVVLSVVAFDLVPRVDGWFLQLLATVTVLVVATEVVSIPFGAWRQLRYDREWGFSTQTTKGFVVDTVKSLPLGIVLITLMTTPLWAVIRATDAWWLWGAAVFAFMSVGIGILFPIVVFPLFNKYTPLAEGELRDEILATAERIGADVNEVLVEDSSKRDKRPNAYVAGLGRIRRVVLFDTMLEQPPKELATVVAHELGHWKLGHIKRQVPLAVAVTFLTFAALNVVFEQDVVLDFAGVDSIRDPRVLPLFAIVFVTVSNLTGLISAWLSRAYERQADLFALDTTNDPDAFVSAFRRLSTENLMDITPSLWTRLKHSHPPAAERMAMGRAWSATSAASGKRGASGASEGGQPPLAHAPLL